jgi:trehalose 6-phosphate phosphatase
MSPPVPPAAAIFTGLNGTLVPFEDPPSATPLDLGLLTELHLLESSLGGALAVSTGRTIAQLDRLLGGWRIPAVGADGLERRGADGIVVRPLLEVAALDPARRALERLVAREPRLIVEDKGTALAVHCGGAPEKFDLALTALSDLLPTVGPTYQILQGRSVLELKPRRYNKGTALADLMREPAFRGRIPIAIGDDVADSDAFRAAERLGGFGVSVGGGLGERYHLRDPAALREWLQWFVRA